jgi:TnpA family transposase
LNALKWPVAFHRSGEVHDQSLEGQSNQGSGLNLVTMVIAVWNTVDLGAVEALRFGNVEMPDGVLAHLSLLG